MLDNVGPLQVPAGQSGRVGGGTESSLMTPRLFFLCSELQVACQPRRRVALIRGLGVGRKEASADSLWDTEQWINPPTFSHPTPPASKGTAMAQSTL